MKEIKRGDEDVRPAGGKEALYLLSENLEMFNWPLHCPSVLWMEHLQYIITIMSSPVIFTGVGSNVEKLRGRHKEWQSGQKRLIWISNSRRRKRKCKRCVCLYIVLFLLVCKRRKKGRTVAGGINRPSARWCSSHRVCWVSKIDGIKNHNIFD